MRKTKKQLEAELAQAKQEAADYKRKYDEACVAMIKMAQATQTVYVPYVQAVPNPLPYPWTTIYCGETAPKFTWTSSNLGQSAIVGNLNTTTTIKVS